MGNSIMGHFAKVVEGIVEEVIVAPSKDWCQNNKGGEWIQTSYNTYANRYMIEGETEIELSDNPDWYETVYPEGCPEPKYIETIVPKKPLHKNFAAVGYSWDGIGFFAPKPFNSWVLNEDTYQWEAPTPYPQDEKKYVWNENHKAWEEVV